MWDLPRAGIETVSPALVAEFLTTVPPGKSCSVTSVTYILGLYTNVPVFVSVDLKNMHNVKAVHQVLFGAKRGL